MIKRQKRSVEARGAGEAGRSLRDLCLDHGLRLLGRLGPERLSLREVARAAGVSPAAPYRHFASREALLAAMAERGFRRFRAVLLESCPGGIHLAGPAEFRDMARHYARFAFENPDDYRLMFTGMVRDIDAFPELRQAALEGFAVLTTIVEVMQRSHHLRPGDPLRLAAHCWSMLHGFVSLNLESRLGSSPRDPESMAARLEPHLDLMLEGIGARPSNPLGQEPPPTL